MKKILALLLVFAMVFSLAGCGNKTVEPSTDPATDATPATDNTGDSDDSKDAEDTQNAQREPSGSLIIGSTTQMNGNFWTTMWGNNAQDRIVRDLIHAYSTVTYQKETGSYAVDPIVVKDMKTTDNADGTKTFNFVINDNLTWNDGTPINAKDFVFYTLIGSSPIASEAGGSNTAGLDYVGYDEFSTGESDTFSGLRLLGEYEFSATVKADELPFFYDILYAAFNPAPLKLLFPNGDIVDEGNGVKFAGEVNLDTFNKTINDSENGYRYKPMLTCGPYQFESFDITTRTAVIKANPYFLGDYNGQKPQIEKLIFKETVAATQIDELLAGTVELLPQVGGIETLEPGLNAVDEGKLACASFPRAGYGKVVFVCDLGPTQFVNVRKAIAHCLDVPEFARQYSGGYASVVYGPYGVAQWMYQENAATIEKEFEKYALDLGKAEELLIEDGWTLNESGKDFVKGTDTLRYKMVDGELMPLIIKHLASTDNPVSALLSTMLPANMEAVGMKYEQTVVEFSVLLNNLYGQVDERQYNMMNLASGFYPYFNPYLTYSTDPQYFGTYNNNYLVDEELYNLAVEMKKTSPDDRAGFSSKWLAFQKRWNQVVPDIPLYSDEYYSFFNTKLKNYDADAFWTFELAVLYAYVEE